MKVTAISSYAVLALSGNASWPSAIPQAIVLVNCQNPDMLRQIISPYYQWLKCHLACQSPYIVDNLKHFDSPILEIINILQWFIELLPCRDFDKDRKCRAHAGH